MSNIVKKSVNYRVLRQIPESVWGELRLRSIASEKGAL